MYFGDYTRQWRAGSGFYAPYQLSGPYEDAVGLGNWYPPPALFLFIPFSAWLPAPLWTTWALGHSGTTRSTITRSSRSLWSLGSVAREAELQAARQRPGPNVQRSRSPSGSGAMRVTSVPSLSGAAVSGDGLGKRLDWTRPIANPSSAGSFCLTLESERRRSMTFGARFGSPAGSPGLGIFSAGRGYARCTQGQLPSMRAASWAVLVERRRLGCQCPGSFPGPSIPHPSQAPRRVRAVDVVVNAKAVVAEADSTSAQSGP